jgi:hypothetical protein
MYVLQDVTKSKSTSAKKAKSNSSTTRARAKSANEKKSKARAKVGRKIVKSPTDVELEVLKSSDARITLITP